MRTTATALGAAMLGCCSMLSAAAVPYTADFSVLDETQTDFLLYTQIGQSGTNQPGIHTSYLWNSGDGSNVTLSARWGNYATMVLTTAGNNNDGVFDDATALLEFTPYLEGATPIEQIRFGMATRQIVKPVDDRVNRYPNYRVDYDGTNLTLSEQSGYSRMRTFGSAPLSITAGTSYLLELTALGTSVDSEVTLTARLFEAGNPTPLVTLTGVDLPKSAGQEGNDWADNGQDVWLSGHVGFYAGATQGGFGGITVSSFSVAVPEPMSVGLVLVPAIGMLLARRRTR